MAVIEAVFFDCDGVLVNTEPLHYRAFLKVLKPYGIFFNYHTYVERYIGFDDRDAFKTIALHYQVAFTEKDIQRLVEQKNSLIIEEASSGVTTFEGVLSFVKSLHEERIPLGLVSGALRKEVEVFLSNLGILHVFSVFVTAEDVKYSKPHPESYQKALTEMTKVLHKTLSPSRCIAFEDTPAGIKSAKEAGIKVIAVEHSFSHRDLKDADIVIPSFKDMSFSVLYRIAGEILK